MKLLETINKLHEWLYLPITAQSCQTGDCTFITCYICCVYSCQSYKCTCGSVRLMEGDPSASTLPGVTLSVRYSTLSTALGPGKPRATTGAAHRLNDQTAVASFAAHDLTCSHIHYKHSTIITKNTTNYTASGCFSRTTWFEFEWRGKHVCVCVQYVCFCVQCECVCVCIGRMHYYVDGDGGHASCVGFERPDGIIPLPASLWSIQNCPFG